MYICLIANQSQTRSSLTYSPRSGLEKASPFSLVENQRPNHQALTKCPKLLIFKNLYHPTVKMSDLTSWALSK